MSMAKDQVPSGVIRVILVDDHALLRNGLAAMLAYEPDIEVVGEAQDGREAIELYRREKPDVVVMDITMRVMGGLEATERITQEDPSAKILIMTQHEEQQFVDALMQTNVSGFIGKRAIGSEFVAAIKAVYGGEFYIHPAMARMVAQAGKKRFIEPADTLTAREREVLERVVAGDTNGQIARTLNVSVKTVEWHRANIMTKLDTHSVADLVRYTMEHRVLKKRDTAPLDLIAEA
jgi:DNA-binding NarL/FixJ family response regulator